MITPPAPTDRAREALRALAALKLVRDWNPKGPDVIDAGVTIYSLTAQNVRDARAALALLAAQPSEEGQPIETAPKDGTLIIVSGGIAYWRDGGWWTLTAEEWPGKPIQWEVKRWWPVPHYQVSPAQSEEPWIKVSADHPLPDDLKVGDEIMNTETIVGFGWHERGPPLAYRRAER